MKTEDLQAKDDVPERTCNELKVKKYAFVSKRALAADHIGYCYRDTPETSIDSGWRFLYGDEDEAYLDHPTNSEAVYPEDMLSINAALDLVLDAPVGSEFEWNTDTETYEEIIQ
ncbi:MAG: DUF2185 domain-containing protein [Dysgonamonadaceae bacterium]|jgi:hypothetical protein|nr:DUF2185 domain-containing protein [Dysgonamonadaceae bacterium]